MSWNTRGWGNLGASPRPPSAWSTCRSERFGRAPRQGRIEHHIARRGLLLSLHAGEELRRGLGDFLRPFAVGARDGVEHAREARHAMAVNGGKICAAVEGLARRGEEDRHRPAAAPDHELHGAHVHVVDVGALLAVDLHVDEAGVHQRGDVVVLEALALHHVTPVARGVADREQDRLVLGAGPCKRLVTPWVPVHRIVRVLQQVRTGLVRETIGVCHHPHAVSTDPPRQTASGTS